MNDKPKDGVEGLVERLKEAAVYPPFRSDPGPLLLEAAQALQDAEARATKAKRDRDEALREVGKFAREAGHGRG